MEEDTIDDAGVGNWRQDAHAGAVYVEEVRPANGSLLYMLRDQWGVPLQICQRTKPFVA